MLDFLHSMSRESQWIVFGAIAALALGVLAFAHWTEVRFMALRLWYRVPLIGRGARLARNDQKDGSKSEWFPSERELCSDFIQFLPQEASDAEYLRAESYLTRANEQGRSEIKWYYWVIILVLLIAEAVSFGYLLAGYIAQQATISQQTYLGYLIAIVIAIALLALTHRTGREWHQNHLRSTVREWYSTRPENEQQRVLKPMSDVSLNNNDRDDGQPSYIQLANRLDGGRGAKYLPAYGWTVFTAFIVVAIGVLAFYMRTELLHSIMIDKTIHSSAPASPSDTNTDIFETIGRTITGPADTRSRAQKNDDEERAAEAAFIVLSLVFIAMQAVGVGSGFFFGFAGRESEKAHRLMGGYSTLEQFRRAQIGRRDLVVRVSQSHLTRLQGKLAAQSTAGSASDTAGDRNFERYVAGVERNRKAAEQTQTPPLPQAGPNRPETEDEMRRRLEAEVQAELAREREDKLRAEIRARLSEGRA